MSFKRILLGSFQAMLERKPIYGVIKYSFTKTEELCMNKRRAQGQISSVSKQSLMKELGLIRMEKHKRGRDGTLVSSTD